MVYFAVTHEHHWPACVNTNALGIYHMRGSWLDGWAHLPVGTFGDAGVTGRVFADGGNRYIGLLPKCPNR